MALYLLLVPLLAIIPFLLRRSAPHAHLPPGPWALPMIGHLHHLAGALPHRALRDLARRHGPLMLLRFGEVPVVVASSPDAAREIMKTHDVAFATRPVGPMLRRVFQGAEGLVFAPYGDAWRQLRKICTVEILSSRRVQSFRAVREDELGRLLRSVASSEAEARPVVNLSARIAAFVADSSVRAIIGCRNADRDAFLRILEEGMKVVPGMSLPDIFPSSRIAMRLSRVPGMLQRGRSAMLGFVDTIIQERRENIAAGAAEEQEDLLDVLLRLQKVMGSQYPLTTLNIKTVIIVSLSLQST
jgi:cytochrome P450